MVALFAGAGWPQEWNAQLTGMSQPALSKQVSTHGPGSPPPPAKLTLDQDDAPWPEGRPRGLGEAVSEARRHESRRTPFADALGRGRKRFTPENVDTLRRLVGEDLRVHREEVPACHRAAYDTISGGLGVPARSGATTGSLSVRRTLAHRILRDRLGGDI
ncbi:sigma-70 family RNA polymerase sigma factor [Streptomyces sp. NPDC056454]|uniref:sigma-70 family RNA polymerase sigma factor n=1 Tax=Streptomyces sp. NPDC056454 TaxID=3345823 RepID=UPI0036B31799